MSPDEILAELRDIRLPDDMATASSSGLSWVPFAVLGGLVVLVVLVRWYRAGAWQRAVRRTLRSASASRAQQERWAALVDLRLGMTGRVPLRSAPPQSLFRPAGQASDQDADELARHIGQELRR